MSVNKIEKLTPEQEALIPVYRDKWRAIALSTEPINRQEAIIVPKRLYCYLGLKEPEVILCDSPYAALILIQNLPKNKRGKLFKTLLKGDFGSQLVSQVQSQLSSLVKTCFRTTLFDLINYQIKWQLDDRIISQLYVQINEQRKTNLHPYLEGAIIPEAWSCAGSYIDYSISVLNCEFKQDEWNILLSVVENCGWIFPFEKICFVCDRPTKLSFDSQQRLHAEGEPAIQFADGFSVYAYHGVRLPEKYGKLHPNEWQAQWLLEEPNAELRRVLIQGIGYALICQELHAIASWRPSSEIDSKGTLSS